MRVRYSAKVKFNFDAAKKDVQAAEARILQQIAQDTQTTLKETVGTQYETRAQLRAKGHPYGRKGARGAPSAPQDAVNRQTGQFYRSFYMQLERMRTQTHLILTTSMPERAAWLLHGTEKMVPRNWVRRLGKGMRAAFIRALETNLGIRRHK